MVHCMAINCTNSHRKCKGLDKKIIFHRIPKDKNLRKKWINAIKRKDPPMTDKSSVCSEHFLESDYERDLKSELLGLPDKRKLKPGAFPSVIKQFEKPISEKRERETEARASRLEKRRKKDVSEV